MITQQPEPQYLYCFFRGSEPEIFTSKGMGDRGDRVSSIHYRDLGLVMSASPESEYYNTRRNMMTHTKVLEEVMANRTILPIRFNTIAPEKKDVYKLLKRRYDELQGRLSEMDGKIEMGLKALWYEGIVFEEILATHSEIRKLRDSLQGKSPNATYYQRIRLGEMVEVALKQKLQNEEEEILSHLRPIVVKVRTNQLITDRMIVNAAFLVDREKEAELDAAIQELDAKMGQRILFRYVGPVPPYNFVNVMISWNN